MKVFLLSLLVLGASAQHQGTQTPNVNQPLTWKQYDGSGGSQTFNGGVTLDSNWRWTHHVDDYVNCYEGNEWSTEFCPDPATCTENCALDGVDSGQWSGTYGITVSGDTVNLKFVTQHTYGTNIGSRIYLLDDSSSQPASTQYHMYNLLNREITFTVDDSELDCGLNGALYLVEMQQDGGYSEYTTNECGAAYGTGYCDAQCPHDMKWIDGEANDGDWVPNPGDPNSGTGHFGICCNEMDLWEANNKAQAFTTHPCTVDGYYRCEDLECGDDATGNRYDGVCDKDGCDFASYRLGDTTFWSAGGTVDSMQPVTVVTQFLTSDGSDTGTLSEVRRLYVQNGQVIQNSQVNIPGVTPYDSITDEFCADVKVAFGDYNDHEAKGGLARMGGALGRGMVFVMSLWDDHTAYMLWLDSTYPEDGDPNQPGIVRGPCPTSSGRPEDVEAQQPDATVHFSDIRFGPIDSTYNDLLY